MKSYRAVTAMKKNFMTMNKKKFCFHPNNGRQWKWNGERVEEEIVSCHKLFMRKNANFFYALKIYRRN